MGTFRAIGRRLKTAWKLSVEFVSLKALIFGAIPVLLWVLKKLPIRWGQVSDLSLLVASYAIVWLVILGWKFIEAGHVLAHEDQITAPRRQYFEEKIKVFDDAERNALAKIVITGTARVGADVYTRPELAGFIKHDDIGYYRVNNVFQSMLENWVKSMPLPRD